MMIHYLERSSNRAQKGRKHCHVAKTWQVQFLLDVNHPGCTSPALNLEEAPSTNHNGGARVNS